jgi:hypothetical protein
MVVALIEGLNSLQVTLQVITLILIKSFLIG